MRLTRPLRREALGIAALAALAAGSSAAQAGVSPHGVFYRGPVLATSGASARLGSAVKITAYTVPTPGVNPFDIALGVGGNLYVTQPILNHGAGSSTYLWQVSQNGNFARVQPQLGATGAIGITAGSAGTVYFGLEHNGVTLLGSYGGGKIHFTDVGPPLNAVYLLTQAADGSLWFSDPGDYKVGHIVRNHYTVYQAPTQYCAPYGITIGRDKNVWVTEQCMGTGKIGRLTPAGAWTEYTVPTPNEQPIGITAGPDGNLWYAGGYTNNIGRVTPGGVINEFSLNNIGPHYGTPCLITVGNDGALWFTVQMSNQVGRITTGGVAAEYAIPGCGSQCTVLPVGITAGVGRTIWFTNVLGNQVDKLSY